MTSQTFGKTLMSLDKTSSTQEDARQLAEEGSEGTLVISEEQTGGRGRMGRKFHSQRQRHMDEPGAQTEAAAHLPSG